MATSVKCDFCDEFNGSADNAFAIRYGTALPCRTVFETLNFAVLPSLGQIVPGYLLVVPKAHYVAIGDMPDRALREIEHIRETLLAALGGLNGPFVFFEHGARTENCGGCGIAHAHLHAVPFPAAADPVHLLEDQWAFDRVSCFSDLKALTKGRSYIYYESASGQRFAFYPSSVQSQYVRRLLADALGVPDWDWRRLGREERLISTFSSTAEIFAGQRHLCSPSMHP